MKSELETIAHALAAKGKGVLAADESLPTIEKRFASLGIESNEENRRSYREMLFQTADVEEYISGVILFDETIRQASDKKTPFPLLLEHKHIIPGIKVDKGTMSMPASPAEKLTLGLDGLRERLKEYRELGARFTKWRGVITIGNGIPTRSCIDANALMLALYAKISQEAGFVPIVEPEVLMDGNHDINRCEEVTLATLTTVFEKLSQHGVKLEEMLLKPNMVLPGKATAKQAGIEEVAEATIRTLRRTVPPAVPGILFLSGGQSPELATLHLNAMNQTGPHPWELGFSFARALQDPAMKAWKGQRSNIVQAQKMFLHRAKCNSAARLGKYSDTMEKAA